MPKRNRIQYFFLIILTIGLGLFSRTKYVPEVIYPYLGDALYALMIFFIIGFIFHSLSVPKVFFASIGLCILIEISQLYQAAWLLELRKTRIGALVLGHGFLWSDIVAYIIGAFTGLLAEVKLLASSGSK